MSDSEDEPAAAGALAAIVLDLDGVVTDTAALHERAWKGAFDPLLSERGLPPFSRRDYLEHVDGKPRLEGARDLLTARGIEPDEDTVEAVGQAKQERLVGLLEQEGVEPFADAIEALQRWRRAGVRTALVSSSRNARRVVEAAGAAPLFEVVIDGELAAELGLDGKPAPDTFLEAVGQLGVSPERAAVLEDAVSGVEAARRGGFACVVGVARGGGGSDLGAHGADVVVHSLEELTEVAGFPPTRPPAAGQPRGR